MIKLTKKQTLVRDFIGDFIETHGFSPSYRDICAGIGLSSVSAVAEHVDNLVALGALKRTPGAARSLEVVDLSHPETVELFRLRIMQLTAPEDIETLRKAATILGIELSEEE